MQLKQEVLRFTIFLWSETHLSMYLSFYLSIFSQVVIQLRKKVVPSVRLVVYSHGLGGLVREGLKGHS